MELYLSMQFMNFDTGSIPGGPSQTGSASRPSHSTTTYPTDITDKISLSEEGKKKNGQLDQSQPGNIDQINDKETLDLTRQEMLKLNRLKRRDTEVRNHEQAHLSNAGGYAKGGASFTYQKGPDGTMYAIGGEVGIDMSEEPSPEATIAKMQTVRKAALAPLQPSATDRQVAAQASVKEQQARQEMSQEQQEELLAAESVEPGRQKLTGGYDPNSQNSIAQLRYGGKNPPQATFSALA
jgi:hypothetical protein